MIVVLAAARGEQGSGDAVETVGYDE